MAEAEAVLQAAYAFAILTFYTGVLIYALPVPWRGVKAWAPRLIADSLFAVILLGIYSLLLDLSDEIPGYLGGSWVFLKVWFDQAVNFVMALKTLIISLYAIARAYDMGWIISIIFWPVNRIADLAVIVLAAVYGLSWLLQSFRDVMVALGIVLYSMPFRVGRSAGAWLIAFTLVFYAGLPALPAFASWLGDAPEIEGDEGMGLAIARVSVLDARGEHIEEGILAIVDIDEPYYSSDPGETAYSVYIISGGLVYGKMPAGYASFPSMRELKAVVEVAGFTDVLDPLPFTAADVDFVEGRPVLNLTARGILYSKGLLVATAPKGQVASADAQEWAGGASLDVEGSGDVLEVTVYAPVECGVSVEASAPEGHSVSSESWSLEWRGVEVEAVRFTVEAPEGDRARILVELAVQGECNVDYDRPDVKEYIFDEAGAAAMADVGLAASIFLYYITIPLLYLALLASVAYGVARLLGGRDRILPRFL